MNNVPDERILVQREFDVELPAPTVWALLAQIERWPEWAPHIRRARLVGGGPLGPDSKGELRFRPAGSGRVQMTIWEPPRLWTWRGRVVGLPIVYHHHFEALSAATRRPRLAAVRGMGSRAGATAGLDLTERNEQTTVQLGAQSVQCTSSSG